MGPFSRLQTPDLCPCCRLAADEGKQSKLCLSNKIKTVYGDYGVKDLLLKLFLMLEPLRREACVCASALSLNI